MIRAPQCGIAYWDKWTQYGDEHIEEVTGEIKKPSANPSYRPQYVFQLAQEHWHQMLSRYSRGDAICELSAYFPPLLDAWEESNRLHLQFCTKEELERRRCWPDCLDHYIVCFWLVGLALSLEIPNDQWKRLVALVDNEGNDVLLDRIIATRQPARKIGESLCHPNPYQRLLAAIDAPQEKQAERLHDFVVHWYNELDRPARKGAPKMYARPYWYAYGEQNMEGGAYFGRWCVEAVAVVKSFGLDDTLCLGHEHYPGDLLRPNGPSTHPVRQEMGLATKTLETSDKPKGWLAKLLCRRE